MTIPTHGVPTPTVRLDMTKYRPVSIGRAAENLPPGTTRLEVWPTELMPYITGEINEQQTTLTHKGIDAHGRAYSVSVRTSICISAEWYPNSPGNQVTAPNVRRGCRVQLWKYADHDEYFWTDLGLDPDLRKLETVTHLYSANQQEDVPNDATNSYQVEVSTHAGHIIIQTTTANGEPLPLTAVIDTKHGTFQISDNKPTPNSITIDFVNDIVNAQNAQGCVLNMMGSKATWTVPDQIDVTTKTFNLTATNINITATAGVVMKAATLTVDAIATFAKAVTMSIGLAVTGALTNNSKNIGATHTHTPTSLGHPTSPPN